jgi:hypothetical protein
MNYNRNTNFVVCNQNGTSRIARCSCGSWLNHHRVHGGGLRRFCARVGCSGLAEVGAHVRMLDRRSSRQWWIVPLCKGCNHFSNDEPMFIDRRTGLVSANKRYTCLSWVDENRPPPPRRGRRRRRRCSRLS